MSGVVPAVVERVLFFRPLLGVVDDFLADLKEIGFGFLRVLLPLNRLFEAFKRLPQPPQVVELRALPVVVVVGLVRGIVGFIVRPAASRAASRVSNSKTENS